jgi:hypothetical protein
MLLFPESEGARVRVHVNLHRGDFSIVDPRTGRVTANARDVMLHNVTFRVQEGGRQRVLKTRCRSVHAYAVGTLAGVNTGPDTTGLVRVSYNPYRSGSFTTADGRPVKTAAAVVFRDRACWIAESEMTTEGSWHAGQS